MSGRRQSWGLGGLCWLSAERAYSWYEPVGTARIPGQCYWQSWLTASPGPVLGADRPGACWSLSAGSWGSPVVTGHRKDQLGRSLQRPHGRDPAVLRVVASVLAPCTCLFPQQERGGAAAHGLGVQGGLLTQEPGRGLNGRGGPVLHLRGEQG